MFKDKKIVVFYCNDLASTPENLISGSTDVQAIDCVHGTSRLRRWNGDEIFHRTSYLVPAIIVAYNIFMNSVDRFDQYRQTNCTERREKRVPMSILTFILDAAINNAYALYQKMNIDDTVNFKEFKRRIASQLAPSVAPSDMPSDMHSAVPSAIPSDMPSLAPSSIPSVSPSAVPSAVPSVAPSAMPSDMPSAVPSAMPSDMPSAAPSSVPSVSPSAVPSPVRNVAPLAIPSALTSAVPSAMPSDMPRTATSSVPSPVR